jgi:hypothetical protein
VEVGVDALHEGGLASPCHPDRDDDMWFSFRIHVRLIARRCAHGSKRKVSLGRTNGMMTVVMKGSNQSRHFVATYVHEFGIPGCIDGVAVICGLPINLNAVWPRSEFDSRSMQDQEPSPFLFLCCSAVLVVQVKQSVTTMRTLFKTSSEPDWLETKYGKREASAGTP